MSKLKIGPPLDFKHTISVRFNPEKHCFDGLPDDWKVLFNEGANQNNLNKAVSMHAHINMRKFIYFLEIRFLFI
jgi:hypothetical protein